MRTETELYREITMHQRPVDAGKTYLSIQHPTPNIGHNIVCVCLNTAIKLAG